MANQVSFEIKGLDRWKRAIAPVAFGKSFRKHARKATKRNGAMMAAVIRRVIKQSKGLEANADLTQHIKASNKPLVDFGDLFKGVTWRTVDDFTAFAGVLRTSGEFNVSVIVHEGVEISVTQAMRGMFLALWQASTGELDPSKLTGRAAELYARRPGGWRPLSASTSVIKIPRRPFIEVAVQESDAAAKAKSNFEMALALTFGERAKGNK